MGELYGEVDVNTHEWTDGVLPTCLRDACATTSKERRWIMFDGPVDALWVENMNTVSGAPWVPGKAVDFSSPHFLP